jgi:hypothetical protein
MHNPFRVSKIAAFWAAVGWVVFSVPLFVIHIDVCGQAFLVFAALYGSIWGYKFYRDKMIVADADYARSQQRRIPQSVQHTPPMTSKGSDRLFVPPPLADSR